MKAIVNDLLCCLRARQPGIHIRTLEEERALQALRMLIPTCKTRNFQRWSVVSGMKKMHGEEAANDLDMGDSTTFEEALKEFQASKEQEVLALCDPWNELDSPGYQRLLRESLAHARARGKTIILIGREWKVPCELSDDIHLIDLPLPSQEELKEFIVNLCAMFKSQIVDESGKCKVDINDDAIPPLSRACCGLTLDDTRNVVSLALIKFQGIGADAVRLAIQQKSQIVKRTGILEYEEPHKGMADVGGLENLKRWFGQRAKLFDPAAQAKGIHAPKGVVLIGPPGTGKTLAARALASSWGQPLVRADASKIFEGLVGGSEKNMRRLIETAEAIAPCVLLIDEIEKFFPRQDGASLAGSEVTSHITGQFLTWLQDKTKPVFVIGTANRVERMDEATLRKGRFDEVFFVDLPDEQARKSILDIHCSFVGCINIQTEEDDLVSITDGFTGAEIEAAVQAAATQAFSEGRPIETSDVYDAVRSTVPQSKSQPDAIARLREFGKKGNARPAGGSVEADARKSSPVALEV